MKLLSTDDTIHSLLTMRKAINHIINNWDRSNETLVRLKLRIVDDKLNETIEFIKNTE